ncbi:hypothetical protein NUM3379_01480 [Kineococcus sp. NUM-3379]
MSVPGTGPARPSWTSEFARDRRNLRLPTAVRLAGDGILADRTTRTRSRRAALAVAAVRVAIGLGHAATGNPTGALRQLLGATRQGLTAIGALKGEDAGRRSRLRTVETLVTVAADKWPTEVDKVLVGMRQQRERYFREEPPPGACPSPVDTGRRLTWDIYQLLPRGGGATEAYREACDSLERRHAASVAAQGGTPRTPEGRSAQPSPQPPAVHGIRGLVAGPPAPRTPGAAATPAVGAPAAGARSHAARTRATAQPRRGGLER